MVDPNSHSTTLTRRELYDRVWAKPGTRLAEEFDTTVGRLLKICDEHRIPRPRGGHWQKLQFGKESPQAPLPEIDDETLEEVRIFRRQFFADESQKSQAPSVIEPRNVQTPSVCEPEPTLPVKPPAQPEPWQKPPKPHPLLAQTRRHLSKSKVGEDKLLQPDRSLCLDVRVSKASLDRALAVYDAFLGAWQAIGGTVELGTYAYEKRPATLAAFDGDSVPLELFEEVQRTVKEKDAKSRYYYRDYDYTPTGKLVFKIEGWGGDYARMKWSDGKRQKVETMIDSLVDGLRRTLSNHRTQRLDNECVERQKQAAQAVRKVATERRQADGRREKQLLEDIEAWKRAKDVRAYISQIRQMVDAGKMRVTDSERFRRWSEWCDWYADSTDPLLADPPHPERPEAPKNVPISDMEFTRRTREIVAKLGVHEADELYRVDRQTVKEQSDGWSVPEWDEICRVLEGLGYDVEGRHRDSST